MTLATSVPILVFLGLSVLDLDPMYATDVRQHHRLMHPPYGGGGIIIVWPLRSRDVVRCQWATGFGQNCKFCIATGLLQG